MNYNTIKIQSKRLNLVPTNITHAQDMFANFTKDVTQYMYPKPAEDISDTMEFIKDAVKIMEMGKNIQVTIFIKDTDEFIGCAGIHKPHTKTPEFGIWIKKSSHGNGYGKEAIYALYEWAEKNIKFDYLIYPVDRRNIASRRIPESLDGKIAKEYTEINQSGFELETIEYHIFKNNKAK